MDLFQSIIVSISSLLALTAILGGFAIVRRMPSNPAVIWQAVDDMHTKFETLKVENAEYLESLDAISLTLDRKQKTIAQRVKRDAAKLPEQTEMSTEQILTEAQKRYGGVLNL